MCLDKEGRIYCDIATASSCQNDFHFENMGRFVVKGSIEPIEVYVPISYQSQSLESQFGKSVLIGRKEVLSTIDSYLLQPLKQLTSNLVDADSLVTTDPPNGSELNQEIQSKLYVRTVYLRGNPGYGKSHMLYQLQKSLLSAALPIPSIPCQHSDQENQISHPSVLCIEVSSLMNQSFPFNLWRNISMWFMQLNPIIFSSLYYKGFQSFGETSTHMERSPLLQQLEETNIHIRLSGCNMDKDLGKLSNEQDVADMLDHLSSLPIFQSSLVQLLMDGHRDIASKFETFKHFFEFNRHDSNTILPDHEMQAFFSPIYFAKSRKFSTNTVSNRLQNAWNSSTDIIPEESKNKSIFEQENTQSKSNLHENFEHFNGIEEEKLEIIADVLARFFSILLDNFSQVYKIEMTKEMLILINTFQLFLFISISIYFFSLNKKFIFIDLFQSHF